MSESLLQADKVCFQYSKKAGDVLKSIDINMDAGKKTALMGCNGAGKSTLFSVLNALYKPREGTVRFKGEPLKYKHKEILRMRTDVAILFQNPNDMMFRPYVYQDVAFGPENLKLPKEEVEQRVNEALFQVGMEAYAKSPIMKLSYGQRKRITLAGVLALRPKAIILDEPTAGLDPQMAYEVMEITEQLHSSGVTVIMSSHDTDLTYAWADELRVLNDGKCMYAGDPESFYSNYQDVQTAGLLLPTVYRMNQTLAHLGICDVEPYPKTQSQLSLKMVDRKDRDFGVLHVVRTDRDTDLNAVLEENDLNGIPRGIYGISARFAQRHSELSVDFPYNAPESCTMKCLSGSDAVLICDPLMYEKAVSSANFINGYGYGKMRIDVI
jgi:cobalt/nickel transport system ATP-binding protein